MIGRILVVDDDKDHAESIADLLNWRGYGVEAAHSGEDALELFARRPFDLTIMDVKLPGMNGVETFFQLRKMRPGAQAIMMTGLNLEQLIASAVGNGAAEILRKPFAMTDLDECNHCGAAGRSGAGGGQRCDIRQNYRRIS